MLANVEVARSTLATTAIHILRRVVFAAAGGTIVDGVRQLIAGGDQQSGSHAALQAQLQGVKVTDAVGGGVPMVEEVRLAKGR